MRGKKVASAQDFGWQSKGGEMKLLSVIFFISNGEVRLVLFTGFLLGLYFGICTQ